MNHAIPFAILAFSLSFAGSARAAESTPVALDKDAVPPLIAKAVEAEAAKGVDALRQYVYRTRMIHALNLKTLVRDDQRVVRADTGASTQVAQR